MFKGFEEEQLPKMQYTFRASRFRVPGGWYVRVVFRNRSNSQGNNESALFLADADHSWQIDDLKWEKIKSEPNGGIYRIQLPGGWVLLSTAQGIAETDDGTKYKPRMGTLTYIPDPTHSWECTPITESVSVM